jgi:hypothetical protein
MNHRGGPPRGKLVAGGLVDPANVAEAVRAVSLFARSLVRAVHWSTGDHGPLQRPTQQEHSGPPKIAMNARHFRPARVELVHWSADQWTERRPASRAPRPVVPASCAFRFSNSEPNRGGPRITDLSQRGKAAISCASMKWRLST